MSKVTPRGRRAKSDWQARVGRALRCISNPSALRRSDLARLAAIERIRSERYSGLACGAGLALRDALRISIENALQILPETLAVFLRAYSQGKSIAEIARATGMTRQYLSRSYRTRCLEVVTDEFLALVDARCSRKASTE